MSGFAPCMDPIRPGLGQGLEFSEELKRTPPCWGIHSRQIPWGIHSGNPKGLLDMALLPEFRFGLDRPFLGLDHVGATQEMSRNIGAFFFVGVQGNRWLVEMYVS